jgi:Ribonucleotide reductase, all-alpha domain
MLSLPFDFDVHGQLVPAPEIAPGRAMPGPKLIFRKAAPHPAPMPGPLGAPPKPPDLVLDRTRDALLTPFGKATLSDRYLMPGESFQDMFARVACAYADDKAHAQRLYDAISRLWFMRDAGPVERRHDAGLADLVLPLPWLVEILNGVEHANFFEQRATEYSKAATRGSWDGADGVWAAFDSWSARQ